MPGNEVWPWLPNNNNNNDKRALGASCEPGISLGTSRASKE